MQKLHLPDTPQVDAQLELTQQLMQVLTRIKLGDPVKGFILITVRPEGEQVAVCMPSKAEAGWLLDTAKLGLLTGGTKEAGTVATQ